MIENMNDKINQLLEERLLALSQKKGAETTRTETQNEIAVIEEYLFGNGTDPGLINVLELHARELVCLRASIFSKPNLAIDSATAWKDRFALAMRTQGDDSTGFYPPDAHGIGSDTLNESSDWLTNNGYSEGSSGLLEKLDELDSARNNLWQKRIEIYPPEHPSSGSLIDPYYFSDPEKAGLLNALSAVRAYLGDYIDENLEVTQEILDSIVAGENSLLNYLDMKDDVTPIPQSLINDVLVHKDFYVGAYSTLSSIVSDSATEATINAFLDPASVDVSRSLVLKKISIESFIESRTTTLKSFMGFGSLASGIKKWIYFFIRLLIQKPTSPYGTLNGVETSIANAEVKLGLLRNILDVLFNDSSRYLPTPHMIATYLMPDENAPLGNKVELVVQTIPCVPVTKIFRRQVGLEEVLSNDPWIVGGETVLVDIVEARNPVLVHSDKTIPERRGQLLLYRVSLHDEGVYRVDGYDTGSLQSEVLGEEISFTKISDYQIEIQDHDFSVGEIFYVSGSGIHRVLLATQNTFTIDRAIASSGSLRRVFGVVHLSEEE